MNRLCPVQLPTLACPGSDSPILNISSEAPDQLYFAGIGFTVYNPYAPTPLNGGQFVAPDCLGVEYSVGSQDIANLLAQINSEVCGAANQSAQIARPPLDVYGYNSQQDASAACGKASDFYYITAPNLFVEHTVVYDPADLIQATAVLTRRANAIAKSYAAQQASKADYCLGCSDPTTQEVSMCLGVVYASTNLFMVRGNPGKISWSSVGLPPGISLSPNTTKGIVVNDDTWVNIGGTRWMNLTTGATQPTQPGPLYPQYTDNLNTADLFGIPTMPGKYTAIITAASNSSPTKTVFYCQIYVLGFTTPSNLPSGNVCLIYNQILEAVGGKASPYQGGIPPYSYGPDDSKGSLPVGISVQNGYLRGSAPAGTYNFGLYVKDDYSGQQCSQAFKLTLDPPASATSFATASPLKNGHANDFYFQFLNATGGCSPYTYSLYSGTLPDTFSIGKTAANDWALTGFPGVDQVRAYNFTLRVTDASGQTSNKDFTLTIDTNLVLTGHCVNNGSNNATVNVVQNTSHPFPANRAHANEEATLQDAVNALNAQLNTNGCTCTPLSPSVDVHGKGTTFSNGGACIITVTTNGQLPGPFSIGPGQSLDYNAQCLSNLGHPAIYDTTFNIGGGVSFTVHYSD